MPMIRYFGVLKFLSQQLTCYKNDLQRRSSFIIITDLHMTSKRAFLLVNGSGSITSVGEERANLSAVIYL